MTNEQLHANRNCPYGGGRKDCPCDGNCRYYETKPDKYLEAMNNAARGYHNPYLDKR